MKFIDPKDIKSAEIINGKVTNIKIKRKYGSFKRKKISVPNEKIDDLSLLGLIPDPNDKTN